MQRAETIHAPPVRRGGMPSVVHARSEPSFAKARLVDRVVVRDGRVVATRHLSTATVDIRTPAPKEITV